MTLVPPHETHLIIWQEPIVLESFLGLIIHRGQQPVMSLLTQTHYLFWSAHDFRLIYYGRYEVSHHVRLRWRWLSSDTASHGGREGVTGSSSAPAASSTNTPACRFQATPTYLREPGNRFIWTWRNQKYSLKHCNWGKNHHRPRPPAPPHLSCLSPVLSRGGASLKKEADGVSPGKSSCRVSPWMATCFQVFTVCCRALCHIRTFHRLQATALYLINNLWLKQSVIFAVTGKFLEN